MADKPWDDTNWQQNDELTSGAWNQHVSDGHFPSDEVNMGVDSNGDPVMTDPQNADDVIARYDRTAGAWVFSSINVTDIDIEGSEFISSGQVLPTISFGQSQDRAVSFSNTSYSENLDMLQQVFPHSDLDLGSGFHYAVACVLSAGTDETAYARLKDRRNGEGITGTEVSTTDTGFPKLWSGFSEYSPNNSPGELTIETKTDPGTNQSSISGLTVIIGIPL